MKRKPHIILFNPDQWRGDVMGHLGNPAAVTPHLDRLVGDQAVSFRHAFCQNPVCTPSRCSFMTGWYPHTFGHRTMYHLLRPDEPNLLKTLKEHGYHVWWGGKNDLIQGQYHPFDSCHEFFRAGRPFWHRHHGPDDGWRGTPGGDNYYSFMEGRFDSPPEGFEGDLDWDWAMVEGACERIRTWTGDGPLCLFIPIGYPHPPYSVEDPYFSMIDRSALPARIPAPEGWAGKPSILPGIAEGQGLQGWTEERWTELRATYYAMCARVDAQAGRIRAALEAAGMWDDSAFLLFSDHGDYTGDYGLVEKNQNTFEDCLTRVPFVVKPPAGTPVRPGVRDALVELVDLTATVFDLAGIDPGYDGFGRSLLPILSGVTDHHRDAVFCEGGRLDGEIQASERDSPSSTDPAGLYHPRGRMQQRIPEHTKAAMCRTVDYKYVRRLYEADELYDLRADPGETVNRIDDPALAGVRAQLADRLLTWYQETCDVVPRTTDQRNFGR